MATLAPTYKPSLVHIVFVKTRIPFIKIRGPRLCMVISAGILFAGLSIPVLMAVELLPLTLGLGFVSCALIGTGGGLGLILNGEL
jgi:hypothetical protein